MWCVFLVSKHAGYGSSLRLRLTVLSSRLLLLRILSRNLEISGGSLLCLLLPLGGWKYGGLDSFSGVAAPSPMGGVCNGGAMWGGGLVGGVVGGFLGGC